jgi:MarR family transcriptional regulator, organic hydroperoxide resistance regulator
MEEMAVRLVCARADYLIDLMPMLHKGILKHLSGLRPGGQQPVVDSRMTLEQLQILGFLRHHGPETMGALAKWSRVALSTMTENINRLAKLHLVMRSQDPRDRRVVRIQLSPRGQKAFERKTQQSRQIMIRLLESLSETNQRKLLDAFKTIKTILLQ